MRRPTGVSRAVASVCAMTILAACGSSGIPGKQSVFYEGPVDSDDYVGRTFPVFFLFGEANSPTGRAIAGQGSITYETDGSITVELPGGEAPIRLTPTGSGGTGTTYSGSFDGELIEAVVSDLSSADGFRLISSGDAQYAVLGGFGFETRPENRPAMATYDTAGAVFLTADNVDTFLPAAGTGMLMADFARGTIEGTLLEADPVLVDIAGDIGSADELALTFMLENGIITTAGFNGGVSAAGELVVDGAGAPVILDADIAGDSAAGAFFGENADAVAATFGGDLGLADGGDDLIDLGVDGFAAGAAR